MIGESEAIDQESSCRRRRLRFNPLLAPIRKRTPTTRAASRHRIRLS